MENIALSKRNLYQARLEEKNKMKSLTEISNLILPSRPVRTCNERIESPRTAAGKLVPIQKIIESKTPIVPSCKEFGSFKTKMVQVGLKDKDVTNNWLEDEKQTYRNVITNNMNSKQQRGFIAIDLSRLRRKKTNPKHVMKSQSLQLTPDVLANKSVSKEESSLEERLKEKNIYVENWIKDCERAMKIEKREQKTENTDLRYPWWIKTAVEMREKRLRRTNKDARNVSEIIAKKDINVQEHPEMKNRNNDTLECTKKKNFNTNHTVSHKSDVALSEETERKICELFVRDIEENGVNLSSVLEHCDKNVFISCCFENDTKVEDNMGHS